MTLRKPGQASIIIIDSIQTVRTIESVEALTPRARVDSVVAALKKAARVDGHLVIATCELARGAYRSKNVADQINDLAAFKESGGIEYGIGVALVLRNVPDEEELVDITVPKNRLGRKTPFRVHLDYRKACFEETARPEPDAPGGGGGEDRSARLAEIAERVLFVVVGAPGISGREVRAAVKGRLVDIDTALDQLVRTNRIENRGGRKGAKYHAV